MQIPTPPKLSRLGYTVDALDFSPSFPDIDSEFEDSVRPINISSGEIGGIVSLQAQAAITSGQTAYDTGTGFWLEANNGTPRFSIGNSAGNKLTWDGSALTIVGAITASSGTIGGFTIGASTITATNLSLDSSGQRISLGSANDIIILDADDATYRIWAGNATAASAPFSVTKAGAVTASNITITGGSIASTPITSIPNDTNTITSLLEKTWTMVFSVTDSNTIAWTSGTITLSNGRTFSISSGNTGNMAALSYIYLDPAVSSTVLQVTTTAATAMGANKILIGTAQNNTVTASFIPYGPGQPLVDGAQIGALSIVAGNIAASTITAGKMSVSQLSAITADLGSITAGTITGNTIQTATSGTRFRMTSTAFEALNAAADYVFKVWLTDTEIGDVVMGNDGSGTYAHWDQSAGTFQVYADNIPQLTQGTFGGDGSDGALSISSGTTTLSAASASTLVKNYTSISITSTGKLAFSNPHSGGTIVTLKSQGAVTITSSGSPTIDLRGIGAAAATDPNALVLDTNSPKGNHTSDPDVVTTGGARYDMYNFYSTSVENLSRRYVAVVPGAGGGDGAGGSQGAGGRGGGALLIECGGALNFGASATINSSGNNGSNASGAGGGGGGGGSAGTVVILYNTLTANSGTITASGGSGGNATSPDGDTGGGAGAGSLYGAGGDGGASGGSGPGAGGGNGAGGGGGAGTTTGGAGGGSMGGLVAKNVYFA